MQRYIYRWQQLDSNYEERFVEESESLTLNVSIELKTKLDESIFHLDETIDSISEQDKLLKKCLFSTLNSMKKLDLVLESTIDFNSLKKNELVLNLDKLHLRNFIFGVVSLFEKSCQEKNIQLTQTIDKDLKEFLNSDQRRITIILYHLLSNAIQNTNQDQIILHISRSCKDQVRFAIIDTGERMKQDQVNHFNNFFSQKLRKEGLIMTETEITLGMILSNSLARLLSDQTQKHQTGISVESTKAGNVFSFLIFDNANADNRNVKSYKKEANFIKIEAGAEEKILSRNSLLELSSSSFDVNSPIEKEENRMETKISIPLFPEINKKTEQKTVCDCPSILIVDDDTFNQLSLKLILKSCNLKSQSANHGLEAIDALIKRKNEERCSKNCYGFKIVFMDYEMPVM